MKYYFRVDSNLNIGVGHYERCFVLGKELSSKNKVYFICSSITKNQKKKLKLANIELIKIKNYLNIIDDAKKTSTYLKEKDILIVDGYKFSNKWISILKKKKINIFLNNDLEKKFITTTINPSDTYINFKKNKFGIPLIKEIF